jgi:Tol biopolymer transport system component
VVHDVTQQVYVSAVDGTQTRNRSNDPERADTGPSWSPDGRELAIVSRPADAWRDPENASGGPWVADIRVILADATNPRTVVAGLQSIQFEPFDMETTGVAANGAMSAATPAG